LGNGIISAVGALFLGDFLPMYNEDRLVEKMREDKLNCPRPSAPRKE
jgi:hypothetical protein